MTHGKIRSALLGGAVALLSLSAGQALAHVGYGPGYHQGYGMGPGQGYAPCWQGGHPMGPGMMHGPGMMQGQGMMMGPGMMQGQAMGQQGWSGPPGRALRSAAIDTNQDGQVSAEEAAERAADVFAGLDVDESQDVTLEEFMAYDTGMPLEAGQQRMEQRRQRREARFQQLDANGDGRLTREEFLNHFRQQFAEADTDGDGRVDPFEFRVRHGGL